MDKEKRFKKHVVYRHYDKDGKLLYIGCTEQIANRNTQHQTVSCWYKDIVNITLEHFDDRQSALKAESKYIHKEKPVHNKLIIFPSDRLKAKELRNKKAFLWINENWQSPPYGEISSQSLKDMVKMGIAESRKNEKDKYCIEYKLIDKPN